MGWAITWCAVREDKAEELLNQLGLSPTGQSEEMPESLISTAKLDTGWRVIWYNKHDCPFLKPRELAALSSDKEILLCLIEEHVMASSSEMWSQGKRQWWLSHEGEDGPKGLATEGDLPQSFPSIRKEMEEAQLAAGGEDADVDYIFEIPLKVAEALVGFKHDENDTHVLGGQYVVLSRATTGGMFRRLFGK
ncbi:MAG: hypothetical protein WDO56_35215 [Gammaproteobacteria bacterium]